MSELLKTSSDQTGVTDLRVVVSTVCVAVGGGGGGVLIRLCRWECDRV